MVEAEETGLEIAVIGMAGRFPGAGNIDRFWENLKKGVESITFYSDEELRETGVGPDLPADVDYVKCGGGILEEKEYFDAAFFGYSPAEAEVMDPQMRVFHECAYHALENAGYNSAIYEGLIGIFAGASFSLIWEALALASGKIGALGQFAGALWIDRDFLCTQVSYRLNLKGPAVVVKSACSTSLAAVHMACRSLLTGECDIALAGGVTVTNLVKSGYMYQEGRINSPDGHCRAFDASSKGTVSGDGVGLVVLKRLEVAAADGDSIYALVKGSALNNDGLRKAGYTTPSVEGQAEVIRMAHQAAEVEPESIGYIEAHGTGTELGDPVEIEGLKLAFNTDKKNFCPIGSVKSNMGHLDSAAGITGFIKAALMLKHRQIPPSINFETPNPKAGFENSPFYVNTRLIGWKRGKYPLRAGVSSFGIGGTNAHVILEEYSRPAMHTESQLSTPQLILLSAKTQSSLTKLIRKMADHFKKNPDTSIKDAAYTLQTGRRAFEYKSFFLSSTIEEAADILAAPDNGAMNSFYSQESSRPIVFMFPGQGAQYVNMGAGLYRTKPVFRQEMDRCFEILKPIMGFDLKDILFPQPAAPAEPGLDINQTSITQPLIFAIEYALAKLLLSWGITPYAMIGHSIGEYAAACLSGVFSLEDALQATALRGRLMQGLPPGTMLSVSLPEDELKPLMSRDISLAAVNSTSHCVVSGTAAAIETFAARLDEMGHKSRRLITSHAFHSDMMNPILPDFERTVKKLRLNTPVLPYISDVTGRWISAEEATDPEYWARHIRETVNFRDGMSRLLEQKDTLFIEVGPGNALSTFLRQHKDKRADHFVLNLVRHPREDMADEYYLLNKVGQLWLYGVDMDWRGFYGQKKRYRLPLPAYPFERCRFFLDTALLSGGMGMGSRSPAPSEEEGGEKTGEPGKTSETVNASLHPRPNLTKPYAAPRTATERKLANIWQNFFGFLSIGSDDNFFELGGDSLNAATVLARIHRELGVKIPLAEVFNSPTLKELAQYIDKGAKSSYAELEAAEEKMYYPLSPAQKRLYILHQFDESSIAYNMLFILSVAEDIDKNHLEQTFSKLINRHESLRTSFTAAAGEPVQKIHDPRDIRFNIEYYEPKPDVGARRAVPGDGAAAGLISRFVRPFDLSEAPLLRVGLIKEAEAKYVLMVDMHHIITDGTSQDLLARDFGVLYSGMELLPLRLQYKDYSEWRQSREMRIALAGQEEFWLDEFAEKAPVLNLPTDFSRPPMQSFAGRLARFELDMAETKKLKEIAQGENATLFMVLLAVYNIFLSKLSSQEDIVVGTAAAGRGHTDLEKIIGMFVNTLALRNFPAGEKSFLLFLNELREKTIKAFENDGFQFEDLLEKMDVKRDMSRNPLFDVMFVFQNYYDASGTREIQREEKEENLKIRPYRYEQGISKLDLTLTASERGDKLFFRVEYCTKLFREETIDRFMNYFKNLVNALVKDPGLKISEIEIIPDQEKNRILVEFNDTVVDFPPGKTLPGLFAEQAGRTPDHAALAFEDKLLTYHYLDSCAGLWAEKIKKAGVQREHIVALMVENGPETVIGMTAIMKAGGAFLPIEPTYPQERKNYLLRDSHAGVLVTTGNLLNGLDNVGNLAVETVFIEAGIREGAPRAAPLKCPSPEPEGLAYAIYTSGSTGKPKGVLVRHNNIVNQLLGLQERYAFETGLHHILLAPFTFDPSVQQIFLPLFTGGKLHVVPKSIKEDPAALFFYIVSRRMDIVNTVPSLMELLLHQTADYKGLSFKYIILAGEIFSPALHQKLTDNLAVDTLINIYGPTEATINTTLYECGPEETGIPIGKPLLNYRVFILDGYLNLQPVGLTGEICIAGAGIARGYLNRPELTAEKFVSAHHAELLYKTGDLGKWLPDGNLQFLGRIDQQVKVRGIRVELGEIENRLLSHAKIEKAVVMAKKYKGDSVDLCAYFVTEPLNESVLSINDIRQFLKEKLPDFMVPSYFKQLEDIPLTKHGKVDLNALPEIGPGSIKSEIAYVAPVSDIEITIAGVWQDILQLEKVGIDDNFFDLGGNSFDIIKVNSKLQEVYEKNLRVVSMFKYPTVRSLAAYFSQSEEEPVSTVIDRSKALERGEKGRTQRRQMRKKQGIKK